MRLQLAVMTGKMARFLSRLLKLGEGSNLPGKLARIIHPQILVRLLSNRDTLLVTGTNGKTTTTHLLAGVLQKNQQTYVHNSYGANLETGIITSLLASSNILGRLDSDYNLFEVDEATLPLIVNALHPNLIILTNIFRDQLDRYGDLDHLIKRFHSVLAALPPTTRLVVNADDPILFSLTKDLSLPCLYYGLEEEQDLAPSYQVADVKNCPRCGSRYHYSQRYYAHLGRYACHTCGAKRPPPQVYAKDILLLEEGSHFSLHYQDQGVVTTMDLPLPGIYNIYNLLAALSASLLLGFHLHTLKESLETFQPVFGRMEEFHLFKRSIRIILVKNPTGFNEVLRIVAADKRKKGIIFFLNDNQADGEDVSWIWDVDFHCLTGDFSCFVSGLRGEEMALRLKYSDIQSQLFPYHQEAFQEVLKEAPGEVLYILPTYTALLRLRQMMAKIMKKERDNVS